MYNGADEIIQIDWDRAAHCCPLWQVLYLTLGHSSNLILDGQHQFGLSGQVLAAPLLVLQRNRDAAWQVVHAADDGQVSIRL